ncbi:uncharacterized protein G2W53_022883 [Senna tora]|uniref:Uncharacterized protein n=1 Tax=Senna tora TaxID=362788 RepID=A0A834TNL9_9FABA|nr:uncharacterized protein G2W53_022883 [Senna tora]
MSGHQPALGEQWRVTRYMEVTSYGNGKEGLEASTVSFPLSCLKLSGSMQ